MRSVKELVESNKKINEYDICKGYVVKPSIYCYINKHGNLSIRYELKKMKSLSCKKKNCKKCCHEMIDITLSENFSEENKYQSIFDYNLKNNVLYDVQICNVTTDPETGYSDGWDIKFVEIKDIHDYSR